MFRLNIEIGLIRLEYAKYVVYASVNVADYMKYVNT